MWMVHTSPAGAVLFAQVGLFFEWDLCLPAGVAIALAAFGLWAIVKVKRWRDEADEIRGVSHFDQLAHYEALAEQGVIDADELARIKAGLEARLDPPPTEDQTPSKTQPPDTSIQEE